jgi:predicted XRE-type DNA-binding protein
VRAFCRFATDGNCWQRIGVEICSLVKTRQLAQAEIGKILGATQPQVSLLVRNRAGNFSAG